MNPEVGPTRCPTQAPHYQAPDPRQVFWEGDLLIMSLPGEGEGGYPLCPPTHAVMTLMIHQQQPRCNLNSALRKLHPHPLLLPKCQPCPCSQPLIRIQQHPDRRLVWLASHTRHLACIFPEANPVEEAFKDAELPL